MPDWLQPAEDGVSIAIWVQPRASRNQIVGPQGDALKVRLTSPPVEGAANKLCRDYFAKLLGVAKGDVLLTAGERSRQKRLLVRNCSLEEAARRLSAAQIGEA